MPVVDIIQWVENSRRSGTLLLSRQEQHKKIYFQGGKIIFVWSNSKDESIESFLQVETGINQQELQDALADSESLGLPFIGYLHSKNIIDKEGLEDVLMQVAEAAIIDSMRWESGTFEFNDVLPSFVLNGPVKLNPTMLLMESARRYDESSQDRENRADMKLIIDEITTKIKHGNVELPPIPDIIQRISAKIENPSNSIAQITESITDQILVSKILRICNSPFYRHVGKISTIRDAVAYIGLKSLMSIVAVHALSSFSPRNADEIRKVLQHCLVCGMVARQITGDLHGDCEQSFICGLLHDIGKTVMLDMLADYSLPFEMRALLIADHHAEIGYLLAKNWNLSEDVQESIRFHHLPEQAVNQRNLVEVIYLANIMAHSEHSPEEIADISCDSIDIHQLNVIDLLEQIDNLDQHARDIVALT